MLLSCGVGEDSWESGDPTSPSSRRSVMNIYWMVWYWSWNSNTLAAWCEELTHLKKPSCWERLKAGGEADNRGWDGWMASPTKWAWVCVKSGSWWWTGRSGVLHPWGHKKSDPTVTELNWSSFTGGNFSKSSPSWFHLKTARAPWSSVKNILPFVTATPPVPF